MAELAGLSVAANVAQFVVYGIQGAQILYKTYRQTEDFTQEQSELASLARSMKTSVISLNVTLSVQVDPDLKRMREQAESLASTLTTKFDKFAELQKGVERGSRRARIQLAVQSLWSRGDIDRLLERLTTLRNGISGHLIEMTRYALVASDALCRINEPIAVRRSAPYRIQWTS